MSDNELDFQVSAEGYIFCPRYPLPINRHALIRVLFCLVGINLFEYLPENPTPHVLLGRRSQNARGTEPKGAGNQRNESKTL